MINPHTFMQMGIDAGRDADVDAPENGYSLVGKTAAELAKTRGLSGDRARSFAQGYLLALDQLVRPHCP